MEYRTIAPDELAKILSDHAEWLNDNSKKCALRILKREVYESIF